jgi:outer membrane protein TolC
VGEQLPTLNISGNHWNSTILVGLNVPIFDGHVRENAIKQAKNNATKSEAVLDRVRIDAIREIVASQNALTTSVSAHQAAGVPPGNDRDLI